MRRLRRDVRGGFGWLLYACLSSREGRSTPAVFGMRKRPSSGKSSWDDREKFEMVSCLGVRVSVACLSGPVIDGISTAPSRQGLFLLREAWPHVMEGSICVTTFYPQPY